MSDIPHVVYQIDEPNKTAGAQHATLANKGNEAMAYLQFIIDYYDHLPPSMIFLQGHRCVGQGSSVALRISAYRCVGQGSSVTLRISAYRCVGQGSSVALRILVQYTMRLTAQPI